MGLLCILVLSACASSGGDGDRCVPECGASVCGDDGCGGSCGSCGDGESCNAGRCEGDTACADTCASLGAECGVVCGESCGECAGAQADCVEGRCACAPDCAGKSCAEADGCGGSCGPCRVDLSCEDCPLRLHRIGETIEDGRVRSVILALDFAPGAEAVLPAIADIRIATNAAVSVRSVKLGEAPLAAGKGLHRFTRSDATHQVMEDGAIRLMLMSDNLVAPIESGRWLELHVDISEAEPQGARSVTFALERRAGVLAPLDADRALQSSAYDGAVVVEMEASDDR